MNILKIKINQDDLIPLYQNHGHAYIDDAGIDLYCAADIIIPPHALAVKIPLSIQLELVNEYNENLSYIIVCRSSIYKTPIRQSQSMSIIDAGFRGELSLYVDNLSNKPYHVKKGDRYFQVISSSLKPMKLKIVSVLSAGSRQAKGLGSSGKTIMSKL